MPALRSESPVEAVVATAGRGCRPAPSAPPGGGVGDVPVTGRVAWARATMVRGVSRL